MNKPHGSLPDSAREKRFLEERREHPQLFERFEAILALTKAEEGAPRTADEIEALLVEEVRRLGSRAMHDWAQGAQERAARAVRAAHPRARLRKKKC